ncbi:protocadherin Fat 4-like [Melanotaenia boesemani]|uniref:protocadherin Fat 4-like n=1 Tax=Melanotaenia boesemani TaxID=1250792 RepID=UPI001C052F05|nr:protocadherin Fat 4-like [Melanotaenia boesemani]XP_041849786.1 protocadherin Fat 4-like [Melanotaenia boesemani]
MEFPPLDRRTNLIFLEFATMQRNSLLLYNSGGSSSREYFALEIIDGMMHLSYDLGSGPVRLQTHKQVTDGHFHSVTARRIGHMGSLLVDNCTDVENDGFCFSKSDGSISERTLDVGNTNMTFGGLRTLELVLLHPNHIKTHDFVGCIRNIHVNGIILSPSMALAAYNILDRCPRSTALLCDSVPCKNGGVCYDLGSDYLCECKSPFTGSDCATEMSEELVVRFNGSDYIEYVVKERFKRDHLLKDLVDDDIEGNIKDQMVISIKFKTQDDGVLLFVLGPTGYIMLMIKDRKPVYVFKDTLSGYLSEFSVGPPVADGVWHVLSLFRNGHNTFLSVDGKLVLNSTERSMDLTPANLEKIILGAAPTTETKLHQSGFSGCVQDFSVRGDTLLVSGYSVMVEVWPSSTLVQSSCSSPGVCLPSPCYEEGTVRKTCLSHCQNHVACTPTLQNKSCICLHNTSEHFCDICISKTIDKCAEGQQDSKPLWLIGVVLPLLSILVVVIMCACLYKARQRYAKSQRETFLQKLGQGTANTAFCFDDNTVLSDPVSTDKEKPYDPVSSDQQRSNVEFYCGASELQMPSSELEYYEIGSICSALHSDNNSLKLNCHKQSYSQKNVKADPKQWGDLKMLFTRFKKESTCEDKNPTKTQNVASLNQQLLSKIHTEHPQPPMPHYLKRFPQPELLEPIQCLTFEEICKLDVPVESALSAQASLKPGPAESTMMTEASSDCETDSTCTCSESEYRQFSNIIGKKYMCEQPALSECNFRQENNPSVNSFFKQTCPPAAGQGETERTLSTMFEQWENILNMHLPYSSYAPIFEDIACLSSEYNQCCSIQSDTEEII